MISTLTIVRYPRWMGWAGFLSMAIFRIPLWMNKETRFWKLLGCGKNGGFNILPDWRQWGVIEVYSMESVVCGSGTAAVYKTQTPGFILAWWKFFRCEVCRFVLQPVEGHGLWDGKACFGDMPKQPDHEGLIAVLTRATIRIHAVRSFWKNVAGVAKHMRTANGFIFSLGIGEMPWIRQATFSIWETRAAMKEFAYQMPEHAAVIRKTRSEKWYSEEMFVRFTVLQVSGTIRGKNPLERKA